MTIEIHTTIKKTTYLGDTVIELEKTENGELNHLKIGSIYSAKADAFTADNYLYVKNIRENKKELKIELKEMGLWEKGMIKAIEMLWDDFLTEVPKD